MTNQMNIFLYMSIEIIIYFNWISSSWDQHTYFKIIILQLTFAFGMFGKRPTHC